MDVVARASRQGIDLDGRGSVLLVRLLDRLRKDVLEADRRRRGPAGRGRQAFGSRRGDEQLGNFGDTGESHGYCPILMAARAIALMDSIEVTPASYAREAVIRLTISVTTLTFGYST